MKLSIANTLLIVILALGLLDLYDKLHKVSSLKCHELYQLEVTEIMEVKDSIGTWSRDTVTWNHPQLFVTYEEAEAEGEEGQVEFFFQLDEVVDEFKPVSYHYTIHKL